MFGKPKNAELPLWRVISSAATALLFGLVAVISAPQLLAFPHKANIGSTTVYAENPIDAAQLKTILLRSDRLLAATGLYKSPVGTRLFLTNGGWRWRLLSLTSHKAFALTRPSLDLISDGAIFNRADPAQDQIFNNMDVSRKRSLSGVIAHERTHMLVRRHFGMLRSLTFPGWKSEGYADYVAQESFLTQTQTDAFNKAGIDHPAILYFEGRKRVAAIMAKNGNSVDQLFAK